MEPVLKNLTQKLDSARARVQLLGDKILAAQSAKDADLLRETKTQQLLAQVVEAKIEIELAEVKAEMTRAAQQQPAAKKTKVKAETEADSLAISQQTPTGIMRSFWRIPDQFLGGGDGDVEGFAFSHDSALLASVHSNGVLKLWNLTKGVSIKTISLNITSGHVSSLSFSPNNRYIAVHCGLVSIWDLESESDAAIGQFQPDSTMILSDSEVITGLTRRKFDGTIIGDTAWMRDFRDEEGYQAEPANWARMTQPGLLFSPSGTFILVLLPLHPHRNQPKPKLYEARTGVFLREVTLHPSVRQDAIFALADNGVNLLVRGNNSVYDISGEDAVELRQAFPGNCPPPFTRFTYGNGPSKVEVISSHSLELFAIWDPSTLQGSIKIWNIKTKSITVVDGVRPSQAPAMTFSPDDGKFVATAGHSGKVIALWSVQ